MNLKKAVGSNFLTWCSRHEWDLLFVLVVAATATPEEVDRNFRQWIREIETADGTDAFRWIRLIPIGCKDSLRKSYVLVDGLSSGEWWFWGQRWKAIHGYPGGHGETVHHSPEK